MENSMGLESAMAVCPKCGAEINNIEVHYYQHVVNVLFLNEDGDSVSYDPAFGVDTIDIKEIPTLYRCPVCNKIIAETVLEAAIILKGG